MNYRELPHGVSFQDIIDAEGMHDEWEEIWSKVPTRVVIPVSDAEMDRWHRLWYGPFVWGDGTEHPCPVDGSLHGEEKGLRVRA